MLAGITAARLLSLREEEPEVFQRVDMLMDNMDKIRWVVSKKLLHNRGDEGNTQRLFAETRRILPNKKNV